MAALWPPLPLDAWRDTRATLHRYAQIIGKIQLALTPTLNHFWNVPFRLSARGLATSAMPYEGRTLQIELDFCDHAVVMHTSDGQRDLLPLQSLAVADFYRDVMATLASLGIYVEIWDHPVEIGVDAIPFRRDRMHATYDPEPVERFWRILQQTAAVLEEFRARFIGKCSLVGFFWGTFDLAVARYSGRRAPALPAGSRIEREAFSHEVSEAGFWPGDERFAEPAFYALHAPAPQGFARAKVQPAAAFWHAPLNCFLLPYEAVRRERFPRVPVLDFCQSTYEAGADLAGWNREELERAEAAPATQPSAV